VTRGGGKEFACIRPDTPMNGTRHRETELVQPVRNLRVARETSGIADRENFAAAAASTGLTGLEGDRVSAPLFETDREGGADHPWASSGRRGI